jgi:hypothetical protein
MLNILHVLSGDRKMKKSMILTACLSTFFTHAMERTDHFSIVLYGTTINVSKQSLCNIANTVDIFIVGKHQQLLLNYYRKPAKFYQHDTKLSQDKSFFYKTPTVRALLMMIHINPLKKKIDQNYIIIPNEKKQLQQ